MLTRPAMFVQIRARAGFDPLAALRREVRRRDATLPLSKVETMEEVLGASVARPKLLLALAARAGGCGLRG